MVSQRKTLKDIASEANLSISAVSQILNGRDCNFCATETKEKVKRIAQDLGYRPNIGYKIMMGVKTKTACITVSNPISKNEEHIQKLILLLTEKLRVQGFSVYICTLSSNDSENISIFEDLILRGTEHFIIIGKASGYLKIQDLLKRHNKTYIGVGSGLERDIDFDVFSASKAILEFFLEEKRSNFRMILAENNFTGSRYLALKSIFDKLEEEKLISRYVVTISNIDWSSEMFEPYAFEEGYKIAKNILEQDPDVQALFYTNDYFAVGAVKYLFEKKYKIGKDIAVAGFNNIHAVKYNAFPISSAEHNVKLLSETILGEMFNKEPFHILEKLDVKIRKLADNEF